MSKECENCEERDRFESMVDYKVDIAIQKKLPDLVKNIETNLTDHGRDLMGKYFIDHERRISRLEIAGIVSILVFVGAMFFLFLG